MPPPQKTASLHLHLASKPYYLLRLPATFDVPNLLVEAIVKGRTGEPGDFISITRTIDEVSIVTDLPDPDVWNEGLKTSSWAGFKVEGKSVFDSLQQLELQRRVTEAYIGVNRRTIGAPSDGHTQRAQSSLEGCWGTDLRVVHQ